MAHAPDLEELPEELVKERHHRLDATGEEDEEGADDEEEERRGIRGMKSDTGLVSSSSSDAALGLYQLDAVVLDWRELIRGRVSSRYLSVFASKSNLLFVRNEKIVHVVLGR